MKELIGKILFYLLRIFRIKSDKVVFCSFYGKGFGCHLKYIALELLDKGLDMVWLIKECDDSIPEKIRQVKFKSLRAFYELATAKVWVDNCRKPIYTVKRKSQFYINTGHGTIPLKRVEKDAENVLPNSYIKAAKHDSLMVNLFTVNSTFSENLRRNSYWYDGKIEVTGSPRVDPLINYADRLRTKVKKFFCIPEDSIIILYAPTFRRDYDLTPYKFDKEKLLVSIKKITGKKCFLLYRLHPEMSKMAGLIGDSIDMKNASLYPDMQELLASSDILITDYSGSMFEFFYLGKPCFLYATDLEEYVKDRDFYFDIRKLPFQVCRNEIELYNSIRDFDPEQYRKACSLFCKENGVLEDGKSSRRVADIILKHIGS